MMERMLEIIGAKTKHINKDELEELKIEFGEEMANNIYEIAGKGSRLSKAELVQVSKLFGDIVAPIEETVQKVDDGISKMDIEQNKMLAKVKREISELKVGELVIQGEKMHNHEQLLNVFSKDLGGIVRRLSVIEDKINKIENTLK